MRLFICFLFVAHLSFGQKSSVFTGKLVYSIEANDTALQAMYPPKVMEIYTNDTLVRVENNSSQFGLQINIRNIPLSKSYLLLSTAVGNYAIKTSLDSTNNVPPRYTYKKKFGTKKIAGLKSKKLLVNHELFKDPMACYYYKKISPKFFVGFENLPGLPVEFYIPTEDVVYKYTLKSIEWDPTNPDLYGIPSDFKKITMDEFVDLMTKQQEGEQK